MCLILEKRLFYINGSWVDPIQGTDCEVIDLTTEEPVAVIALAGQADTDAAVAAAKAALPEWSALPVAEHVEYVQKIPRRPNSPWNTMWRVRPALRWAHHLAVCGNPETGAKATFGELRNSSM